MRGLTLLALSSLFLVACSGSATDEPAKLTVGETAVISIEEAGMPYVARIDTGAKTTSVHALDLEVIDGNEDKADNVGKTVSFTTINEHGEEERVSAVIERVAEIRNAQGIEYRYVVELDLKWHDFEKRVQVNLRDRSKMTYKLLIGRNWLEGDVVVDVSLSEGTLD